jgi:hypothetical protein
MTLYVSIHQVFRIFIIPGYQASVFLVTKLDLVKDRRNERYYVASQEDLYQTTEFLKFAWFGIWYIGLAWQLFATAMCLVGAFALSPITWVEEKWSKRIRKKAVE